MQQCAFNAWIPNMYHVSSDTMYHVSDPNTKYLTVVTLKLYSHNSYTKWLFPIPILLQCLNSPTALQLPSNKLVLWVCKLMFLLHRTPYSLMVYPELLNWVLYCPVAGAELTLTFLVPSGWARLQNTAYLNKVITNKIITWSIKLDT